MDIINIDFVKPNPDCSNCDQENDYTCFDCEEHQVREKYPNAVWTDDHDSDPWEKFVWVNKTQGA